MGLLATVRLDDGPEPQVLLSSLPDAHAVRHVVGPLTVGAVHDIVRAEIGSISRPLLMRLHESSDGNPLYALELARALAASGHEPEAGEPLALPPTLERLTEKNLAVVDDDVRETLLVVALLTRPREHVVAEALDDADRAARDLQLAEDSRLLAIHRDEIRFTHPLIASVLVASTPERSTPGRASSAGDSGGDAGRANPPPRARHPLSRCLGRLGARRSGVRAQARAAPAAAAELAEHALHLTPATDGPKLFDRNLRAGRFHHESGASTRGREFLTAAVACASTGAQRAAARLHLANATVSSSERLELLRAAAAESEAEPGTRAEILAMLGSELPDLEGPGRSDVLFAQAVSLARGRSRSSSTGSHSLSRGLEPRLWHRRARHPPVRARSGARKGKRRGRSDGGNDIRLHARVRSRSTPSARAPVARHRPRVRCGSSVARGCPRRARLGRMGGRELGRGRPI